MISLSYADLYAGHGGILTGDISCNYEQMNLPVFYPARNVLCDFLRPA